MLTQEKVNQPYRALMAIRFANLSYFPLASVTIYTWNDEPVRCYWCVITRCIEFRGSKLLRHKVHFFGRDGWLQDASYQETFDEILDFTHELLHPARPQWKRCELLLIRHFACLDPTWLRPWGACT